MSPLDLKMRGLTLVPGTTVPRTEESVRVSQMGLSYRIPTLDVTIRSAGVLTPKDEDYVILKDPTPTTIFSGKVKQVATITRPVNRVFYEVTAQGWEAVLAALPVTTARTFAAGTPDSYMLKVLLGDNYGPISTTAVPVLYSNRVDMPAMTFDTAGSGKGTLGNALNRIFAEAGCDFFWIDGDKVPHYNDVGSEGPYVLVKLNETLVKTANVQGDIEHYEDNTNRAIRIRVIGNAGVEYTAVDWMQWDVIRAKMRDEPGSPTERFLELPDELDTALLTSDECRVRAFQRLEENRVGRTLKVNTRAHGFRPGQLVAVHDTQIPPLLDVGDFHGEPNGVVYPHAYWDLHRTVGWLQVHRVALSILDHNRISYVLELGDPQPTLEDAFRSEPVPVVA